MGILWHGTSNIWLWILIELNVSPIIVDVAREGAIGVSVLRHRSSDVRLRVLIELNVSPIIVDVTRECAVGMGILRHWSPNVWLWVLSDTDGLHANIAEKSCNYKIFHYFYYYINLTIFHLFKAVG